MSNEDPPVLTGDQLAALWDEIGHDAVMVEAMRSALSEKLHRYECELDRAHASSVRQFPRPPGEDHPQYVRPQFRPQPSGPPDPPRGWSDPGDEATDDSSSL